MYLESSDQIITLLPVPPLVSTSVVIKSPDHGCTMGVGNKQTALFTWTHQQCNGGFVYALQQLCLLAPLNKAAMLYILVAL